MCKSIIISSCLFGSVYIFSKSLQTINNLLLENNKKLSQKIILLNVIPFIFSGSIIMYSCYKSLKYKI